MTSKEMNYNSPKVWSCGNKHCPHDCYWPTTFSYTTEYEHYVWGSDNKFRSGADNCGQPQFLFHWEQQGKGANVTPKHCHKPVLKVEAGTALKWRISTVGLNVRFFQPAFPSSCKHSASITNKNTFCDEYRTQTHKDKPRDVDNPDPNKQHVTSHPTSSPRYHLPISHHNKYRRSCTLLLPLLSTPPTLCKCSTQVTLLLTSPLMQVQINES